MPLGFTTWRAIFGALALFAIIGATLVVGRSAAGARAGSRAGSRVPPRQLLNLSGAIVANLLLNLTIFEAFSRVSVTIALLAFYTYPAILAGFLAALRIERIDRVRALALAGSLAGMAIVVLGSVDASGAGVRIDPIGVGLALVSALCEVAYTLIGRSGFPAVQPLHASAAVLGGAAIVYAAIALASGSAAVVFGAASVPGALPFLVIGGVIGAALPQILFLFGVRRLGGLRTGILMLLEPVTGVVLAAIVLGEPILPIQLAGGALVLGSALLLQVAPARLNRAPSRVSFDS